MLPEINIGTRRCLSAHAQGLRLVVSCFTGFVVIVEDSASCYAMHRKALCPALLLLK